MAISLHLPSSQRPNQPPLLFPSTNTPTTLVSFVRTSKPSRRLHQNQILLPIIPSSSFRNGSNTPSGTEFPVPLEQQPINEYQDLSTSFPFSWAAGDFVEYCSRLFMTGASFALLAYVGNRLLSATVEYEETGWYDGQVKSVLSKLKYTLVTLALSLFICVFLLVNTGESQKASNKSFKASKERAMPGVYSDKSTQSFESDAFCGEPGVMRKR